MQLFATALAAAVLVASVAPAHGAGAKVQLHSKRARQPFSYDGGDDGNSAEVNAMADSPMVLSNNGHEDAQAEEEETSPDMDAGTNDDTNFDGLGTNDVRSSDDAEEQKMDEEADDANFQGLLQLHSKRARQPFSYDSGDEGNSAEANAMADSPMVLSNNGHEDAQAEEEENSPDMDAGTNDDTNFDGLGTNDIKSSEDAEEQKMGEEADDANFQGFLQLRSKRARELSSYAGGDDGNSAEVNAMADSPLVLSDSGHEDAQAEEEETSQDVDAGTNDNTDLDGLGANDVRSSEDAEEHQMDEDADDANFEG